MLNPTFPKLQTLLCLGAHADDIEIGCGGTVLRLLREHPRLQVIWVVFSAGGPRTAEARAGARLFLHGAPNPRVIIKRFRTSFFPFQGEVIKEFFESLRLSVHPDLVFTHCRDDRHQDHRLLSDLAWNTFRDHLILEYEIPKYDGDLGVPSFYVRLDEDTCRRKAEGICTTFRSQADKHWFSPDTFLGLMRLRGVECASPTRYAEGFYARKLTY